MRHLNKIIEYGVLLFVFLVPWQARWIIKGGEINGGYWEYGAASLYATEVLLGLILAVIVIKTMSCWSPSALLGVNSAIASRLKADSIFGIIREILSALLRRASRMTSGDGVLLFLLIWSGLSVFWAVDVNVALQHWVFLVLAAALFVVLGFGVPSPFQGEGRVRVFKAIILSASIQAAIALIQFFSQSIPGSTLLGMSAQSASTLGASVVETIDGRWLRAYGTFPHPNLLGAWLVLGLVLLMRNFFYHSEPDAHRVRNLHLAGSRDSSPPFACGYGWFGMTGWAAFVVILSGLLVTFSRSAWLAFILVIGYWLLVIGRRREQRIVVSKIIAVTILAVVLFAALFPDPFLARLSSSNRLEIKSDTERVASLSQSWQIIKKYPLTGVGLGNYGLAVHRFLDNTKPAWYYQPVHNVPLLIWSELGLIGILVIGYWLLVIGRGCRRSHFETIIYLLPLVVLSLFDHYLWSLYPGMMIGAVWPALLMKGCFSHCDPGQCRGKQSDSRT